MQKRWVKARGLSDTDRKTRVPGIIEKLRIATQGMTEPAVTTIIKTYGRDPFLVLISCLLSLRTRDTVSLPASLKLFDRAKTPLELLDLSILNIEHLIYPVGFYRQKAKQIHHICNQLVQHFNGNVPDTEYDLLTLKGVGRKTANLVLGEGFGIPSICVDTHVHRISNRLNLVRTKTPAETEHALKKLLPKEYWIEYNRLLVMWGQNICVPITPFCSICPIADLCAKRGVKKNR
ncbi:endonuclease III [Candidatus Dependentiae bacterium]|nr:endonuclease III [Candidatus Dependentiae bacterium]